VGPKPDPIFSDARLARIYDVFNGDRDDLAPYLAIAQELRAHLVLDVGCGTGSFAHLLANHGFTVVAVDPAKASLVVARAKGEVPSISWIHGEVTELPALQADLAVMTGNVAQVFLSDAGWLTNLRGIHRALRSDGYLVFETRRPERRIWQEWAADPGPVVREISGIGNVEQWRTVTHVEPPFVSFRYTYRFTEDGTEIVSDSTLRFRSRQEVEASLIDSGFRVLEVRDAPDRPGHEHVFIAQRAVRRPRARSRRQETRTTSGPSAV
jgi:SAM-dependent methyltransferase